MYHPYLSNFITYATTSLGLKLQIIFQLQTQIEIGAKKG